MISDHELQSYEEDSYMNYLPKKFIKGRQKSSSEKNKLEIGRAQERTEYTTTAASMQSPQSTNHTQSGLDTTQLTQVNISHLFVRQFYKSNPNTPFRKKSVECYDRGLVSAQQHFEYSPYKLIKQNKQENMYDTAATHRNRQFQNVWYPIKNIQNMSFDSQIQLEKQRKQSVQNVMVVQEDDVDEQNLQQIQNTQSSPKKRQIFKSVFSNLLQQNKNQLNVVSDEKKRIEDLQKGLVIKNIKPKTIFTNATLVKTQQNFNSSLGQRNRQAATPNKQRVIKSSASNRPASAIKANKRLPYSEMNSSEKHILNYLSGEKMNNTFMVTGARNETPCRENANMRATNLSFYTGDLRDQKQFIDTGKNFHSATRPKTAGSPSRSPTKQIIPASQGQTSPHNVNVLYKRLSQSNQSSLHLELDKDFSFQVLGKSSQIFSSPKHKTENQNGRKVEDGFTQEQQDQVKEIEQKVKEGIISPTVNNTTVFNSRNVLKKHHFVKNVADISLFEKNKKVQMHQFVFESPSPSKRAALRQSVNNNFFTSLNCVEIFNL